MYKNDENMYSLQHLTRSLSHLLSGILDWLVSTGHVVSFTNGVYSQVEKYPKYGPQWRKCRKGAAKPEKTVGTQSEAEKRNAAEAQSGEKIENKEVKENETAPELAE